MSLSFSSMANAELESSTSSTCSTSWTSNDSLLSSSEDSSSSFSWTERDSSPESTSATTSSIATSSETATESSTLSDALTALKQQNKTMNKAIITKKFLIFISSPFFRLSQSIKLKFHKKYFKNDVTHFNQVTLYIVKTYFTNVDLFIYI